VRARGAISATHLMARISAIAFSAARSVFMVHPSDIAPRPLLLLHAKGDTVVPVGNARSSIKQPACLGRDDLH
jgi:alpha-beta hydrolase superfamily lysophospholipase